MTGIEVNRSDNAVLDSFRNGGFASINRDVQWDDAVVSFAVTKDGRLNNVENDRFFESVGRKHGHRRHGSFTHPVFSQRFVDKQESDGFTDIHNPFLVSLGNFHDILKEW